MVQVPSNLIPARITQLQDAPVASEDGLLVYVYGGVTYKIRAGDLLSVSGVPTSRQVIAGTGLQGGGQLSSNVTLSIAPAGVSDTELSSTGVTPGVYGDSLRVPVFTVNAQGRLTTASSVPIASDAGGTVRSVDFSGGTTGLVASGGPVTDTGTITLGGTLNVNSGGTGAGTQQGALNAIAGGVTSGLYLRGDGTNVTLSALQAADLSGVIPVLQGGTGADNAADARTNLGAAASGANSDITSLSGLTGGISAPDFVQFDTTITPVTGVGKLQWDPTSGSLQVGLVGGVVNQQIGQEMVVRARNTSGSAMTDGQVVYIQGATGAQLSVELANASSASTSQGTIGLVTEPIANNDLGFVTAFGLVNNIDTSSFSEGDVLYLGTSDGALTTTPPVAPNNIVRVGVVVRVHPSLGSVFVSVHNGFGIEDLNDVTLTGLANNDILKYNSGTGVWGNAAASTLAAGSLAGGIASQIPYQSAPGTTAFIANGTAGQVLTSAGAGTPVWAGLNGGSF